MVPVPCLTGLHSSGKIRLPPHPGWAVPGPWSKRECVEGVSRAISNEAISNESVCGVGWARRRGKLAETDGRSDRTHLDGIQLASIGPVTSLTLRDLGLRIDIEARAYTIPGLVEAIVRDAAQRAQ